MKKKHEQELLYGLKGGNLVSVTEVASGLGCGCHCPCCGAQLVAKKGLQKTHHFAHHHVAECAGALQTSLHLMGKAILERRKEITIPGLPKPVRGRTEWNAIGGSPTRVKLDEVVLEKAETGFVPDLSVSVSGRRMFIEIFVTHAVDKVKLEKMRAAEVAVLEIDLSEVDRAIDEPSLEMMLVEEAARKRFLFNPRANQVYEWVRAQPTWDDPNVKIKKVQRGYRDSFVYGCPLTGKRALLVNDCFHCEYLVEADGEDNGSYPALVHCGGHSGTKGSGMGV